MSNMMTFPETWEEFEKSYGFADSEEVYTNGSRLIPSFRVKQWLDHIAQSKTKQQATVSSDLISRQDAIEAIHEDADWLAAQGSDWQVERMERDKSILMSLPSAEKAQLSGEDATFDCISRQDAIEAIVELCKHYTSTKSVKHPHIDFVIEELNNVPSTQPERKKGKWIEIKYTFHHKCSNCEWINNADSGYNFCPNCGADMREGEEDEVS